MKKTISALVVVLALTGVAYADPPAAEVSKGTSDKESTSNEKSRSETTTDTDSTGKGGQNSHTVDTGISASTRKELRQSLDSVNKTSLTQTLPVLPVFYGALAESYPWIRGIEIDDLLTLPIGLNNLYQNNLNAWAQRNSKESSSVIMSKKTRRIMNDMQRIGIWIRQSFGKTIKTLGKPKDKSSLLGVADIEEVINLSVKFRNKEIEAITPKYDVSGTCFMTGEVNRIKCGACILDVSGKTGVVELTCDGRQVLTAQSADGVNLTVNASTDHSMSETESLTKSDESFKRITDSLNNYVKWAADHSDAVAAAKVKKSAFETAVTNDRKLAVILKGVDKKEDPQQLLSIVGFK